MERTTRTDLRGTTMMKSRYYQPEICRFISADSYAVLTQSPMALVDANLYNYRDNNPVYREDDVFCQALFPKKSVRIPCF